MLVHTWCHEKTTMHPWYVLAWTTFSCGVEHTCLMYLPCAVCGIAMHVTATHETLLGKYLTMP